MKKKKKHSSNKKGGGKKRGKFQCWYPISRSGKKMRDRGKKTTIANFMNIVFSSRHFAQERTQGEN
jgi:hypothetical protein